MNTIFLFIADLLVISFFLMRNISGKKWGHAAKPKSFKDFITKEFMLILLVVLVAVQHFGFAFELVVLNPIKWISVLVSCAGILICFETRRARSKTWGRFGEKPAKHKLTTTGPHVFSRHPYYLGVCLWVLGVSVLYENIIILVMAIIWSTLAMLVATSEEKFLQSEFGDEWTQYKKRTPFFFGIRSLLP